MSKRSESRNSINNGIRLSTTSAQNGCATMSAETSGVCSVGVCTRAGKAVEEIKP